jgi:acyl-CoA reductase-like NAD-dependent aldehyde dehydrogenase
LIGEDQIDRWEDFLDVMETSIAINSGRGCINCSGIWVPRHGRKIAEALAQRLAKIEARAHDDPQAALAAFTVPGVADAISASIDADLQAGGGEDLVAKVRGTERLVKREHCAYLLPTLVYCESPEHPIAKKEYMFPFSTVVECPQEQMLEKIGPTLVGTGITEDPAFQQALLDSPHIDRLNLGAVPTTKLDWLQPHEGNIVDFLYRARAFQSATAA